MKRESLTEMLTEIIDSMHDGFFVVARSGEIIMANSALLEMTGYSHDEVVGRTCTILQCDECRQHRVHCGEHWCQLFARGETIRQFCNIMTKDGRCLHVLKSSQVVLDDAETAGRQLDVANAEGLAGQRFETGLEHLAEDHEVGLAERSGPLEHRPLRRAGPPRDQELPSRRQVGGGQRHELENAR